MAVNAMSTWASPVFLLHILVSYFLLISRNAMLHGGPWCYIAEGWAVSDQPGRPTSI